MKLTFQFLGTGTSVGVPQIGCRCPTCTSTDVRDRRRRSGLYVRCGDTAILVDAPPELREACLEYGVKKVDAVLITHAHMDHVAGFDDVRRFNTLNGDRPMNCYAAPATIESMHSIFPYISNHRNKLGLFRPLIVFKPVRRAFRIGCVKVTPLPVEHGGPCTVGWLFEAAGARAAYVSDCIAIPERTMKLVRGVDVMVLDCLREREHPTHFNREKSLAALREIGARRGYLTHMSHSVLHAEFSRTLPRGVRLAYDGLTVSAGGAR